MSVKPIYITIERWKNINKNININKNKNINKIKELPRCSICLQNIKKMTKWDRLHLGLSTVDVENDIYTLLCKHHFHKDCILKWFEKSDTCPNCRRIV
tara:strand:- start:550 stop:843 length:294 start_codon:yes stop_codon:yes gene_type:complete